MVGFDHIQNFHRGWDLFQRHYQEKALIGWLMMRIDNSRQQGAQAPRAGHIIKITFIPHKDVRWEIYALALSDYDNIRWVRYECENYIDISTTFDVQFFNNMEELRAVRMLKNIPDNGGYYTWTAHRIDIVNTGDRYRVKILPETEENRVRH